MPFVEVLLFWLASFIALVVMVLNLVQYIYWQFVGRDIDTPRLSWAMLGTSYGALTAALTVELVR